MFAGRQHFVAERAADVTYYPVMLRGALQAARNAGITRDLYVRRQDYFARIRPRL
jgi:hypothetical protein